MLAGSRSKRFHARTMDGVAADWQVKSADTALEFAFRQGNVSFLDGASTKCVSKFGMRIIVLCDEDEAGSLFVETVHYARTERIRLQSATRKILSATQKRVYKRAPRIPCSRVHAHSGRFVDDQQVVIFVDDVLRNGFRFGVKWRTLEEFY